MFAPVLFSGMDTLSTKIFFFVCGQIHACHFSKSGLSLTRNENTNWQVEKKYTNTITQNIYDISVFIILSVLFSSLFRSCVPHVGQRPSSMLLHLVLSCALHLILSSRYFNPCHSYALRFCHNSVSPGILWTTMLLLALRIAIEGLPCDIVCSFAMCVANPIPCDARSLNRSVVHSR